MSDPLDLFTAYMTVAQTVLGVSVVLGYPDIGRPGVVLPIAALTFVSDAVAVGNITLATPVGRPRIGATLEETAATLTVYLENERVLLSMAGLLRAMKRSQLTITVDSSVYHIRYGASTRGEYTGENRALDHSLSTDIVFTRS